MFATLAQRNASALEALRDVLGATPAVEALRMRHPQASLADRLGAHLLSAVPRQGGHTSPRFAELAREWEEFVRSVPPRETLVSGGGTKGFGATAATGRGVRVVVVNTCGAPSSVWPVEQ